MRYSLAPHIGFALIDRRVVLLDVATDRYRLIEGPPAAALAALSRDDPEGDPTALGTLLAAGIIQPGGRGVRPLHIDKPLQAIGTSMPGRYKASSLLTLCVRVAMVVTRLRILGLRRTLDAAGRRKMQHRPSPGDEVGAVEIARMFRRLRPSVPIARICLRDALSLFEWLVTADCACSLVFGVKLDPFQAHCWVQTDRTLLTGELDSIAGYHPILVI